MTNNNSSDDSKLYMTMKETARLADQAIRSHYATPKQAIKARSELAKRLLKRLEKLQPNGDLPLINCNWTARDMRDACTVFAITFIMWVAACEVDES